MGIPLSPKQKISLPFKGNEELESEALVSAYPVANRHPTMPPLSFQGYGGMALNP